MDPLVSSDWLADRLGRAGLVVVDATWFMPDDPRAAKAEYVARHIPGAVYFGIDDICDHANPLPHMLSPAADFAVAARRLGISAETTVVIYDAVGLFSAPRVWWNFRVMGHDEVCVLDGGLPHWIEQGRPVETGWPEPPPHGDFKARPRPDLVRDLEAVRQSIAWDAAQIVDARPAARFSGQTPEPRAGLRAGHMPGAHSLPSSLLAEDGRLKSPADLAAAFEAAGVDLRAPIIATCGSGVSAASVALALARLGRPDVAVYDGSWTEWGARADTVVVTGP